MNILVYKTQIETAGASLTNIISSFLPDKVPGFRFPPTDNRPLFEKMIKLLIIKTNTVKLVISVEVIVKIIIRHLPDTYADFLRNVRTVGPKSELPFIPIL